MADLGLAAKTRPVVIVSRHDPEPPRALVLYVPLTTQDRRSSVSDRGVAGLAPLVRLERRMGLLPNQAMLQIKLAMVFALDLRV